LSISSNGYYRDSAAEIRMLITLLQRIEIRLTQEGVADRKLYHKIHDTK
jgi:hypothetical protein